MVSTKSEKVMAPVSMHVTVSMLSFSSGCSPDICVSPVFKESQIRQAIWRAWLINHIVHITQAAARKIPPPPHAHLTMLLLFKWIKVQSFKFLLWLFFKNIFGLCLLNSKFIQLFTFLNGKKKANKIYHQTLPLLESRTHRRHCCDKPHMLHSHLQNEKHL